MTLPASGSDTSLILAAFLKSKLVSIGHQLFVANLSVGGHYCDEPFLLLLLH
jgi:hypothetical protein